MRADFVFLALNEPFDVLPVLNQHDNGEDNRDDNGDNSHRHFLIAEAVIRHDVMMNNAEFLIKQKEGANGVNHCEKD